MILNEPGYNWDRSAAAGNSEVFVANTDGSHAVNISNSKAFDGWPVWVDNETVLFSSNRSGIPYKGQLILALADGSEVKAITPADMCFIQSTISRDGKYIYTQHNFEGSDFEFGGIVVIPLKEAKDPDNPK
jgi:Tol biopolymer transport system component